MSTTSWLDRWESFDVGKTLGRFRFDEEPVPLTVFVQDRDYLANPPLSDVQYEAVRHSERVYGAEVYAELAESDTKAIREYWSTPTRLVNFVTLEWGKGGGKDHICRMISLRIAYLLLCLPSPQDYYAMPSQDTIHLLNVASSSKQASRAFFTPMRRAVTRPGNWFVRQGVEVHEVGRGQRRAAETVALQDTIRFAKNIEAISGHSDAETQEGLNLILGIADEIDAFKRREELARHHGATERDSTRSAEGILDMIRSSGRTRFPETFKNVRISYPRYKGSMIQTLVEKAVEDNEAKGERSAHYVSGPLATWDVNPRVPGKEAFQDDYDADPIFSAAKYECKPSRALNPFFVNEQAVEGCMEKAEQQPLTIRYVRQPNGLAWVPDYTFSAALKPIRGAQYAMHADLAKNHCRAGVAVAHVVRHEEVLKHALSEQGRVVETRETRPVVRVDFVIGFEADAAAQPPREIQIRWARELWFELVSRGFAMRRFTFDGYESLDSRQMLETQYGVETKRVSTDMSAEPWRDLRDLTSEDRLRMVREPLFLRELFALSQLPNGKIDHPPGGSKDLADAVACACQGAVLLGGREDEGPQNQAFPGGEHMQWAGRSEIAIPAGFGGVSVGGDPDVPVFAGPGNGNDRWLYDAPGVVTGYSEDPVYHSQ